jgi:hypothetical protein
MQPLYERAGFGLGDGGRAGLIARSSVAGLEELAAEDDSKASSTAHGRILLLALGVGHRVLPVVRIQLRLPHRDVLAHAPKL